MANETCPSCRAVTRDSAEESDRNLYLECGSYWDAENKFHVSPCCTKRHWESHVAERVRDLRSQLTQALAKRDEYAGLLRELVSKPPRAITRDGEEYCGLCGCGRDHADHCLLARTRELLSGRKDPSSKLEGIRTKLETENPENRT